jgi:hypothetical protein
MHNSVDEGARGRSVEPVGHERVDHAAWRLAQREPVQHLIRHLALEPPPDLLVGLHLDAIVGPRASHR